MLMREKVVSKDFSDEMVIGHGEEKTDCDPSHCCVADELSKEVIVNDVDGIFNSRL